MLNFRYALIGDVDLYFKWTNDSLVRQNSLNTKQIDLKDHIAWFTRKIEDPNVFMYLFTDEEDRPVGQVIIEKKENSVSVGQSVAGEHRGKKYSTEMLTTATDDFLKNFPRETIVSVVKVANIASLKMSANSGFTHVKPEGMNENVLVLKGYRQNDEKFIRESKQFYNII